MLLRSTIVCLLRCLIGILPMLSLFLLLRVNIFLSSLCRAYQLSWHVITASDRVTCLLWYGLDCSCNHFKYWGRRWVCVAFPLITSCSFLLLVSWFLLPEFTVLVPVLLCGVCIHIVQSVCSYTEPTAPSLLSGQLLFYSHCCWLN